MNARHPIAHAALLLSVAACFQRQAVEITPENETAARSWTAKLATPPHLRGAVQAQGTATMGPRPTDHDGNANGDGNGGEHDRGTWVEIRLSNVAPGGMHPWRVQAGRCVGSGHDLLFVTDEERMLRVESDGTAEARAHLPSTPVPAGGDYSIVVLASPENQEVVIACGNFAPPPVPSEPRSDRR
jgi:hypothetical protein